MAFSLRNARLAFLLVFVLLVALQHYDLEGIVRDASRYSMPCPRPPPKALDSEFFPRGMQIPIYYLHARPAAYLKSLLRIAFGDALSFTVREDRVRLVPYVVSVTEYDSSLSNASLSLTPDESRIRVGKYSLSQGKPVGREPLLHLHHAI